MARPKANMQNPSLREFDVFNMLSTGSSFPDPNVVSMHPKVQTYPVRDDMMVLVLDQGSLEDFANRIIKARLNGKSVVTMSEAEAKAFNNGYVRIITGLK